MYLSNHDPIDHAKFDNPVYSGGLLMHRARQVRYSVLINSQRKSHGPCRYFNIMIDTLKTPSRASDASQSVAKFANPLVHPS